VWLGRASLTLALPCPWALDGPEQHDRRLRAGGMHGMNTGTKLARSCGSTQALVGWDLSCVHGSYETFSMCFSVKTASCTSFGMHTRGRLDQPNANAA
jgi:hypothetical protein